MSTDAKLTVLFHLGQAKDPTKLSIPGRRSESSLRQIRGTAEVNNVFKNFSPAQNTMLPEIVEKNYNIHAPSSFESHKVVDPAYLAFSSSNLETGNVVQPVICISRQNSEEKLDEAIKLEKKRFNQILKTEIIAQKQPEVIALRKHCLNLEIIHAKSTDLQVSYLKSPSKISQKKSELNGSVPVLPPTIYITPSTPAPPETSLQANNFYHEEAPKIASESISHKQSHEKNLDKPNLIMNSFNLPVQILKQLRTSEVQDSRMIKESEKYNPFNNNSLNDTTTTQPVNKSLQSKNLTTEPKASNSGWI